MWLVTMVWNIQSKCNYFELIAFLNGDLCDKKQQKVGGC